MPELKVRIGCVVLAVVMSAVTYYFVEPRLRWGRFGGYKAAGLLSVMVIIGIAGYSVMMHDGYAARMDDPEQKVIDALNKRMYDDNQRCLREIPDWNRLGDTRDMFSDIVVCKFQKEPGNNTIALIGDSHAGDLYAGLTAQTNVDEGIIAFPGAAAVPLIGLHSGYPHTEHLLSEGFGYILSHENIKKVVLSHRPFCSYHKVYDTQNPGNRDFNSIMRDGFIRTYDTLMKAGKQVYVILDKPEFGNWTKCLASVVRRPVGIPSILSKNTSRCSERLSDSLNRESIDNWNKVSQELAVGYKNIHFIDMEDLLCIDKTCSLTDSQGNMLYRDSNHFNMKGSIYAAPFIMDKLRN